MVHCNNLRHFRYAPRDENAAGGLTHQSDAHIIGLMVPYQRAACKCERDALSRVLWADQAIGTAQQRYVMVGADFVGCTPKPENGVYKKVCPVPYQLTQEDKVQLGLDYPGFVFYSTNACHHDHAMAHTRTMLNTYFLKESLPLGTLMEPAVVIDISGNPAANTRDNRRERRRVVETCCKAVTPKDMYRKATKWGPQVDAQGNRRWHNLFDREIGAQGASLGPERMREAKALMSIHTLYYLSHDEVWRMLDRCAEGAVFTALIHKFGKGASGTVNCGEQKWGRKDGQIQQTNVKSGESYTHADSDERWFDRYNWVSGERALTWSVNYMSGEMWKVSIIKYDPRETGEYVPVEAAMAPAANNTILAPEPVRLENASDLDVVIRDKRVPVKVDGATLWIPMPEKNAHTYDKIRRSCMGKNRDQKQWNATVARCNLLTKQIAAENKVVIDAGEMMDICVAAFWTDLESEVGTITSMFDSNWKEQVRLANVNKFGSHSTTKSFIARYLRASATIGAAKDTGSRFQALAQFINDESMSNNL